MATLPRPTKSPSVSVIRPHSEFDAGINTSNAWTQHQLSSNLFDQESLDNTDPRRPARALYDFEGKPEFRELTVHAGDELEVVKEDLADGWSLVSDAEGEIGLLPRSYYTLTSEFTSTFEADVTSPSQSVPPSKFKHKKGVSTSSITPRNSVAGSSATPIIPQNTGEWMFPSFRQSLLGGKSLNRFSSFVTSGAEEWVLKGKAADTTVTTTTNFGDGIWPSHEKLSSVISEEDEDMDPELAEAEESAHLNGSRLSEADRHFVDAGHAWKSKLPPFKVLVHSPSKRTSILSGAYTVYNVTSLFDAAEINDEPPPSPTRITVQRRFSQFVILHTALCRRLPGIALPPLPEKQYSGRFSDDFVEARRGDLERYIGRIVRHPVARYAEVVTWFLSCESEAEWKRLAPHHLSKAPAGPSFYAQVFHPAFNLDLEDAEEAVERFATHTRAVGKGVQGLRSTFGRVREARLEISKAERLLSYSLLSLITCKPLASPGHVTGIPEEDESEDDNEHVGMNPKDRYKGKGLMNEHGAWCWREGCQECLVLTKSLQRTAETFQSVADLYDDHARRTQLATHESLKGVAHPLPIYEGVVSTHRSTLKRYSEAGRDGHTDDEMASRCETVLNTTMAEMETYHSQKVEDFRMLAKDHLDGEIALYSQILSRLRAARDSFDSSPESLPTLASPSSAQSQVLSLFSPSAARQPSIYERELEAPRLTPAPLLQPCPHVFDSTPMRPVSVAIGTLLGGGYRPEGRGSVFGNLFW
ncbi:hypothetical protein D9757_004790 [Collybiopsis confluens]|uniref:PX-domain-containing protein n=1 Tax=Collybiopsis confluens TaxID=2823264 RepID=A0A8H5HT64_9AGAR|nr:hypothetical protein D9757_004790 [Collybiopsis confluens]